MSFKRILLIGFLVITLVCSGCFSNIQLRSETSERVRPERTVEQTQTLETAKTDEQVVRDQESESTQTESSQTDLIPTELSETDQIYQEWGIRVAGDEYVLDLGDTVDLNGIEVTLEEIYITQDEEGTTLLFDIWRVKNNTGSSVNVWYNISLGMLAGPGNYALTYISGYEIYPPATSIVDVQSLAAGDSRTIYTCSNRYVGEGYYLIEACASDPNTGLDVGESYFYLVWIPSLD